MKTGPQRLPMSEINVTPFVDVVLVLLIIFMVTAPFLQGGLEIDLPKVASRGLDVHEGLIVSVRADRTVAVGNDIVPLERFENALSRAGAGHRPVFLKADQGVQIFDLGQGKEIGRVATTQPITHGIVVSPDGLYAFVTNESIGSTRGTVDVIDLRSLQRVASVAAEYQPGGIDFWRMTN